MQQRKKDLNPLRKPAFLNGGKITPGDLTVRNAAGYPIDAEGNIDQEATKRETADYYTRLHSAKGNYKTTNYTPPKKRRK